MNAGNILFSVVLILSGVIVQRTESAEIETKTEGSQASVSSSVSNGPTYNAEMLLEANNKDCVENAVVEGNGVSDNLKLPCTKNKQGREVVNEKNKIVIGGEPGDSHGILGNKPNSLVVMDGDKCVERSYLPGGKRKEKVLSDKDCAAAKDEMKETKNNAKEKKEKEKKEFDNIGKDLEMKTKGLKLETPSIDFNDPVKLFI